MNKKGFIFTMDAALSLIPVFILLISTSSLAPSASFGTIRQMKMTQFAQDSMVVLYDKKGDTAAPLEVYLNSSSTTTIDNFLRNTNTQWNYLLQMNTSSGWINITGNVNDNYVLNTVTTSLVNSNNTAVATKIVTNVTGGNSTLHFFRMYVWEG